MLLSSLCFCLASLYFDEVRADTASPEGAIPFDYFLRPGEEDLAKERPLVFNPEDGHDFRKLYEDKYGYRGERLIAMLGGGSAPLAIYDAALLDHTTTTTEGPSTTDSAPSESKTTEATNATIPDDDENQIKPKHQLKYVELDRKNQGFLTESFLENNIPQHQSYQVSPEGVIYNRLYGAIWNYGANGLPKSLGFDTGLGGLGLGGIYSNGWTDFDFNKPIVTNEREIELVEANKPSEKEFAGFGEPSIMVKSYSYR